MDRKDPTPAVPMRLNAEEAYFLQHNEELIRRHREALKRECAAREREQRRQAHWMKCPKCGSDLEEIDHLGIQVDRCTGCHGVFFDCGELDLLLQCKRQRGFLVGLKTRILG